jgi:hypothetical protein
VTQDEFSGLVLSSSIALEAVLFGVFGVLYSVYALYASLVNPEDPIPPPICRTIRLLCRILAILMALSAFAIAASAYQVMIPTYFDFTMGSLLGSPIVGMLAVAMYMAWFAME